MHSSPSPAPPITSSARRTVGIVAGWGRYPVVVAERLAVRGDRVVCLGLRDHADPALAEICHAFDWIGIAQFGRAVRLFQKHRVVEATLAGKFHKVRLYGGGWWRHRPDWHTIKSFYPHFVARRKSMQDDSLLGTVVGVFQAAGITMRPATDYLPELLVKLACLTDRQPSTSESKDIAFGWNLAKEMGRLDVGQSVVVKERAPLAIEAIEGTDECIRRAGTLCAAGGFTVVKVAKPQQDMRFDVPTIGLGTLETMAAAGGRVLAVEAGRTIIIDEPQVIQFANRHRIVIVALNAPAAA